MERWSKDHKLLIQTWDRGGVWSALCPWLLIAAHGQPILKERIELEIETDTKTKISLPRCYFRCAGLVYVTYSNGPQFCCRGTADRST